MLASEHSLLIFVRRAELQLVLNKPRERLRSPATNTKLLDLNCNKIKPTIEKTKRRVFPEKGKGIKILR